MKHEYKVGDLVRVKRQGSHGIKFGAVCEIVSLDYWAEPHRPQPAVRGFTAADWNQEHQLVDYSDIRPAKQAMRKRDEYKNRRG